MTHFLDTSVLVAAFWGDHPGHDASLRMFAAATPRFAACAGHSLAEVYAVMTRLPVRPVIPADQATLFVEEMQKRLTVVSLDANAYASAIGKAAANGITGGRVYDALILECARVAMPATIYTWNLTDFRRIAPDLADRLRTP